jgi:hypothetical protein
MAQGTVSTAWYLLVFAAMGFFLVTFAAIMSHIPRIPQQRGLLVVILISALASIVSLVLTQAREGSEGLYQIFLGLLVLTVVAALLDLFYFVQARRRGLEGANWSLYIALALLGLSALGFYSQYGAVT